jgi:hypothetical protein
VVIGLIFFWNILGVFLKRSFQWYALYEIFLREKFHRNDVLNVLTFEIVCAQNKRGNSSLYFNISFDLSTYYRMYWCRCLHRCFRHRSIALNYQCSMTVTCWKIINYSLSVECELLLLFFRCKQFKFDIFVTALC